MVFQIIAKKGEQAVALVRCKAGGEESPNTEGQGAG